MTNAEIIALGAFIVTAIAFLYGTKRSADSSQATLFFLIERDLAAARSSYLNRLEVLLDIKKKKSSTQDVINAAEARLDESKESLCNVIEAACAQYIDGRISKKRFEKHFKDAFRDYVRNPDLEGRYKVGSKHPATIKCIAKWFPA